MKKELSDKLKSIANGATNVMTNALLIAGNLNYLSHLDKIGYSSTTEALEVAAVGTGLYLLNKKGYMKKFSKWANDSIREIPGKAMPYIRNGVILPLAIAGSLAMNYGPAKNVYNDFSGHRHEEKELTVSEIENEELPLNEPKDVITKSRLTTHGKFERTYRWDEYIDKTEEKYGIEKGLLAGLIMRESYGNPVQLNRKGDGGAGLMMFQPGTARAYGLHVYGTSNVMGRDTNHGKDLLKIAEENNYNYEKLIQLDDRFSVPKSMDAGGKFLKDLKQRFGTWDRALSAYNAGTPKIHPEKTNHVKMTREYQKYYNKRDKD